MEIYEIDFCKYGNTKKGLRPDQDYIDKSHIEMGKPYEVYWASPCDNTIFETWETWSLENGFRLDCLEYVYKFKLTKDAKILIIDNPLVLLDYIIKTDGKPDPLALMYHKGVGLDWNRIMEEFDGVFLYHGEYYNFFHSIFGDNPYYDTFPDLYKMKGYFNAWNCDSLAIWNTSVIDGYYLGRANEEEE